MWRVNTLIIFLAASMSSAVAQELRDPTAPPAVIEPVGAKVTSVASPKLQSIQWMGEQHRALIDGAWKQVGDRVGPYQVNTIDMSGVVLRNTRNSKDITIRLFGFSATPVNPTAGSSL
ncbi:MAG: hypothetical protein COA51_08355 [Idiomarina sp.]|jgi:hypothetical protein|nr:MAG: hypothetical protein COA51_08355 [Idiomarina sp.]